jgi:hypothetical protein
MAKIYEDFCQRNCGHLKISEKRCYRGECFLKNFFDEVLLKIPQETMLSLSQALHAIRIEEVLKKTRYGSVLKEVKVEGRAVSLLFSDENLPQDNHLKVRYLNPEETAIISLYKVLTTAPQIEEVKIYVRLSSHPEINIVTNRQRAIELIDVEGMSAIKKDWNKIWDYFKPLASNPTFSSKVRSFLNGYSNENPVKSRTGGWLGRFMGQ